MWLCRRGQGHTSTSTVPPRATAFLYIQRFLMWKFMSAQLNITSCDSCEEGALPLQAHKQQERPGSGLATGRGLQMSAVSSARYPVQAARGGAVRDRCQTGGHRIWW